MGLYGEADVAGDLVERELEARVRERLHPATVVANRVVVVLAVRLHRLEAGDPGAELDALDEPHLSEQLEHAVHAGNSHRPAGCPRPVEDLLRCQAARLAAQELDDRSAGAAVAKARHSERLVRMADPVRGRVH